MSTAIYLYSYLVAGAVEAATNVQQPDGVSHGDQHESNSRVRQTGHAEDVYSGKAAPQTDFSVSNVSN